MGILVYGFPDGRRPQMTDNMKKIHYGLDALTISAVLQLKRLDLERLTPDEFRLILASFAIKPFLDPCDFATHLETTGVVPAEPFIDLSLAEWKAGDRYPSNFVQVTQELIKYLETGCEAGS